MCGNYLENIIFKNELFTILYFKEYDKFLEFIHINELQQATVCLGRVGYLKHRVNEGVTCYFLVENTGRFNYLLNVWPKGVHHGDLSHLQMLPDKISITCRSLKKHAPEITLGRMFFNEGIDSSIFMEGLIKILQIEPVTDDEFKLLNIVYNLTLNFTYTHTEFYDNFFNKLPENIQLKITNIAEYLPEIKKHFL